MIEHDQAAVLRRLHDAGVRRGSEREAVRTTHARRQQRLDRLRHVPGYSANFLARRRSSAIAAASPMPTIPARWSNRGIRRRSRPRRSSARPRRPRRDRDRRRRGRDRATRRATTVKAARNSASGSTRRCAARSPLAGGSISVTRPEVDGGVFPTGGPGEVDEPARGEAGNQSLLDLGVERAPTVVADRRVRTQQVIHRVPFRLPMPSEPDGAGADPAADSATVSMSMIDPAVNRYVRR